MKNSTEETKVRAILQRLEGKELTGRVCRLPCWAVAAILGAGFQLSACDSKDPCKEDCNNITPNVNNLYGNVNNYNNSYYNMNNYNNPLYGIQDAGGDVPDADASDGTPDGSDAGPDAGSRREK